ncbi:MAG: 3',5'-cyclic-nucleotide phosphodiesterase [Idiomarina sp.]|nr:3',5'-cyclic-nucleotide phosphodiesterase [Idiomarina sp.]
MKIDVLGCSGGLSDSGGSTCIRICEYAIIDAGTGLSSLPLAEMRKIRAVVLTHAHMDHIAALPLFLSNMFDNNGQQVTVYAQAHTIQTLRENIFNNAIWPDYTVLPTPERPILQFVEIQPGDRFNLAEAGAGGVAAGGGVDITVFPVDHTIPTVGVSARIGGEQFVFSSDTTAGALLDAELAKLGTIDIFMLECSFTDDMHELAVRTKHMTPSMVRTTVANMAMRPKQVWISHLKPSCAEALRTDLHDFFVL